MVMSAMATGSALCSNTDIAEDEGKKVQNEGSLPLAIVDKIDSNGHYQKLKNLANNSVIVN